MKNIHLLLAGESRLSLNRSYRDYAIGTEAGEPYWTYSQYKHHMSVTDASVRPHNMYITNEEKFVRDEYITDGIEVIKATPKLVNAQGLVDRRDWKKIILTTDQALNKDGVWGIEDGFLEWFVKNPTCDYVELKGYAIILPGESCDCDKMCSECEAKQETPEEAAERTNPVIIRSTPFGSKYEWVPKKERKQFVEGAKWQQEQDKNNYSEVFEWLANKDYLSDKVELIQKEFEEFKKK
jgi:hypothetical protein